MHLRSILVSGLALGAMCAGQVSAQQEATRVNPLLQPSPLPYGVPQFDLIRSDYFRTALDQGMREELADVERIAGDTRVILLGSVATGKYVDVLVERLGPRLHFPPSFTGRGDMSRGGLLLRHAASGIELEYAPLDPQTKRHGPRPPKLDPRTRIPVVKHIQLSARGEP